MQLRGILLAAGILGGVMPVLAAQPTTAPPSYDETVVVTAALDEQPEEETSSSVTVIGQDEIEERQATSVEELLRTVPGVTVVRSGSPGKATSVFMRGTESDQTLVLWNGIELNDPFFGSFDWAFLPTDGVERVEVVRGPASARYGSEAIGGVVQVLTRSAPGTSLRLEGGAEDFLRGALTASAQAGPVHLDVAGHVRRGRGRVDNDFFDGEELAVRADWAASDTTAIGLVARANDSTIGVPYDFLGNPSPERTQDRQTRQVAVPVTWRSGPWKVDAQLSHTQTALLFADPNDPFTGSDTDADRDGARVVGSYVVREGLWAAVGADWERDEVTNRPTSPQVGGALDNATQETWSTFGQLFWDSGPVAFDLGVRRDDNDTFGAETTLRAAATAPLGAGFRLRGSYAEGFRAPSLGDLYYPGFGNPDLRPETSDSVEVGLDWASSRPGRSATDTTGSAETAGAAWRLGMTAFSIDLDNLIVFDFVRSLPLNIGRARSRGLELSVERTGRRLSGRLGATYQEPEDLTTGEQLLRRPQKSASLVVAWHPRWLPARASALSATVDHVGSRPGLGAELDAYTTVGFAASWHLTERIEPTLRVENLLDEQYEEAVGFPAFGRRVIGGVRFNF